MKSETKMAIKALRNEYARKLLMFELEMNENNKESRKVECKTKAAIRNYSMSTPNKRNFIMRCCLSALNGKCISVADTTKLLGISSTAMDSMVNECFEAGWIEMDKDNSGYRRIKAKPITLECWMDYADYVNSVVDKFDFVHLNASRRAMEILNE